LELSFIFATSLLQRAAFFRTDYIQVFRRLPKTILTWCVYTGTYRPTYFLIVAHEIESDSTRVSALKTVKFPASLA